MNIVLIHFAIKYKGDWDKIYKAIEEKEKVTMAEMKIVEKLLEDERWKVITLIDPNYPKWLKSAYKPPFVFWYKGDANKFNNKFICATGNQIDDMTEKRIDKFVGEIEKNYNIVTGNYPSADQKIIEKSNKTKLFILAGGIEKSAPKNIDKNDLLFSEYPPASSPKRDHFRNRNRLIAAFASSLILFSSLKDGPINDLVSNILNLGKDVYAFPGNGDDNDGNSELIKQGATLITSIKDVS